MTALSVNLNKIALLRNSREGNFPDVVQFGEMAIKAGADGLTVHPRPDQRHIHPDDARKLAILVREYQPTIPHLEFNIEGNPFAPAKGSYPGLIPLIEETLPDQATLVPDNDEQLTSDHGFDLFTDGERLKPLIEQLKSLGVRACLFMDPDIAQIEKAKELGIDRIELYTGPYAFDFTTEKSKSTLARYHKAAVYAHDIGLGVNAGHDLSLENLRDFLTIPNIAEVSIGHVLTVDALLMGYEKAIKTYSNICKLS